MDNIVSVGFDLASFSAIMVLMVTGLGVIASMMVFDSPMRVPAAGRVHGLPHHPRLSRWAGMVAAPFVVALVGLALERDDPVLLRRARRRQSAPPPSASSSARACGLIGGLYHAVPDPLIGSFSLGAISSPSRCMIILVAAVVLVGFWILLTRTGLGLTIRASLENPALARASGISTNRVYALTFAVGAGSPASPAG